LNGIAVGQLGTILRTADGGQTWVREESGTSQDLYGVSFPQINAGTAVGSYGAIFRTTTQGPTPRPIVTPRPRPTPAPRPTPYIMAPARTPGSSRVARCA